MKRAKKATTGKPVDKGDGSVSVVDGSQAYPTLGGCPRASDPPRSSEQAGLPPAPGTDAGDKPTVVEPPSELVAANVSARFALSSAPAPHIGTTVGVRAIDLEARARAEEAEPSREAAQAIGGRTNPFVVDDPALTGDTEVVVISGALSGEGADASRAVWEAVPVASTQHTPTPEAPTLETMGGSAIPSGAATGGVVPVILAPTGDLLAGATAAGGNLEEHGGAAAGTISGGRDMTILAAEGTTRVFLPLTDMGPSREPPFADSSNWALGPMLHPEGTGDGGAEVPSERLLRVARRAIDRLDIGLSAERGALAQDRQALVAAWRVFFALSAHARQKDEDTRAQVAQALAEAKSILDRATDEAREKAVADLEADARAR